MKYLKKFESSEEDIKDKIEIEIKDYLYILEDEGLHVKCIKRPKNYFPHNWGMKDIIMVYIVKGPRRQTRSECKKLINIVLEFIYRIEEEVKKFDHKVIMSQPELDLTDLERSLDVLISTDEDIDFSILIR